MVSLATENDWTTEATTYRIFTNDTNDNSYKHYAEINIGFGAALLTANVISLGFFLTATSVGKSLKIIIQALIANDIAFSVCLAAYGLYALDNRPGSLNCWGFLSVLIATTFSSYMTISLLAFFNYIAVLWPALFKSVAMTKRTVGYVLCIWLLSWGATFALLGNPTQVPSCNLYTWLSSTKIVVGAMVPSLCICLVFFFNIKVITVLCAFKRIGVSATSDNAENVAIGSRAARSDGNPQDQPRSDRNTRETAPTDVQGKSAASSRRWKNDPRRLADPMILSSRPRLVRVECAPAGNLQERTGSDRSPREIAPDAAPCEPEPITLQPAAGNRHRKNEPRVLASFMISIPGTVAVSAAALRPRLTKPRDRSVRDEKFRRTSITLSILTLWPCLLTLPTMVFLFVVVLHDEKQVAGFLSQRVFCTTLLLINYFSNPILHAWRLVAWDEVRKKAVFCFGGKCTGLNRA